MKLLKLLIIIPLVLFLANCATGRFLTKGSPKVFNPAEVYWEQLKNHKLAIDSRCHWNYALNTVDVISYSQEQYFPVKDPYDMTMFKKWVDKYKYNELELKRVFQSFSETGDYGWPPSLRGIPWMQAAVAYVWAAPSVAIIEPGRTAEAAFLVKEFIELMRSPAGWMDYAITQGYGDPMRLNVMWKGPLLMSEGIYTLMTGDTKTYGPEMKAIARNLYKLQLENLKKPLGQGFSGGVECEPNHWFPQCNSMAVLGLAMYDKIFGTDEVFGVKIGEEYRKNYIKFIKEYMSDPKTGLIYRRWHPYGPQQADKDLSGFSNIFVALNLHAFFPEYAEKIYKLFKKYYLVKFPLGMGTAPLEVPERNPAGELTNPGAYEPGMLGETYLNFFLTWVATREFNDKELFHQLHKLAYEVASPYYLQGEVRFDETNKQPSGIDNFTVGQMFNMFSGWWLFAKVHVGWKNIIEHDWSKHKDKNGRLLNY